MKRITLLILYQEDKDFGFVHDPAAQHFEADWAKRFPRGLMLVLKAPI